MPFPDDETIMKTAGDLVEAFQTIFGKHPGFRPAHAKGILLTGTFTPTPAASTLSVATHFNSPTTPILARFSTSTGLPHIPDTTSDSRPNGLAIRFHLPNAANGHRVHTDLITHSVPMFPTRTGAEFLTFLKALMASGGPDATHPTEAEKFIGSHPAAARFVTAEKPAPESFATQRYYGVSAFTVTDRDGKVRYVRYTISPAAGVKTLTKEEVEKKGEQYLQTEMEERVKTRGGTVEFSISVQVAEEGDVTDDATVEWPAERRVVEVGTVRLEKLLEGEEAKEMERTAIFDPIPRVSGVGPSEDPLLEMRAAVYLISGKQRREAVVGATLKG